MGKKFPELQEFEAPRFQYSQYMKVVMLSAVHTIRLYPQGYNSGSHFCYGLSHTQGHSAEGRRVRRMKNPNDSIGNRTRDLPARITVSLLSAPPRASISIQ